MIEEMTKKIKKEVGRVLVGQEEFLHLLLVCLFTGGHVLIEGVPGLGKTLAARTLSEVADVDFRRIQFTPDMMPSDVTGTNIFDLQSQVFHLKKGPLFTHFLLADEINRTPPKTQSALLEAMAEGRITIDGHDYVLEEPFMVFATQNPIEYEGTYPLPEAQLDRFLMKIQVSYPAQEDEKTLLYHYHEGFNAKDFGNIRLQKIIDRQDIAACKEEVRKVKLEESMTDYILAVVAATRHSPHLLLGASPRASVALLLASKALAAMEGRDFVTPDDVKYLAPHILRHRIIISPEAEIEGVRADHVIGQILDHVKVPR
ncbi:MAG: MoxR family ATPase [Firmicutes bacterium]|nr:MoxR family ATPase [Bacillota bacterium]